MPYVFSAIVADTMIIISSEIVMTVVRLEIFSSLLIIYSECLFERPSSDASMGGQSCIFISYIESINFTIASLSSFDNSLNFCTV